jgi:TonB-dependent receptor
MLCHPFRPRLSPALAAVLVFAGACSLTGDGVVSSARAQAVATGTIEGRVSNPSTGDTLEKARLTIEGTPFETFTDADGHYRFTSVPAGAVRIRASFTGLTAHTATVIVITGQTSLLDVALTAGPSRASADGGPVKLDHFVVATSREMDGAALAINEQRFASNILNVVSTDEFGATAEGNVGQFLKHLPGMTIDYAGGDARSISMNGVPGNNVPITVGGFDLASGASGGTVRTIELELVSINNISRIEVSYSPTPESPGSALAGSVNMVPRGAFERVRPVLNVSAFAMFRDNERTLAKTPGLFRKPTRKTQPGFDFSWVVPVNRRFGFTLSGNTSTQYAPNDLMSTVWRGTSAATNGAAYPDTPIGQPYLTDYAVLDGMKTTTRSSIGTTLDYKLTERDRLSLSFQYAYLDAPFNNRTLTFLVSNTSLGQFSTKYTRSNATGGALQLVSQARKKSGTSYMPTFVWRHDGAVWKVEAGTGHSYASNHYVDIGKGLFQSSTARRNNVTVTFDNISYLRPETITVTEPRTGQPVDPFNIDSYVLTAATSVPNHAFDVRRSAYANARRDLNLFNVPVVVKGGLDVKQNLRDIRGANTTYNYVGADRRATVTPTDPLGSDDGARAAFDTYTAGRGSPFGFPGVQWVSNERYWDIYQQHPEYFTVNEATAHTGAVNLSKHIEEVVSSAYVRTDAAFFQRRLKGVVGLRAEQTNVQGEGPLTDPTRNFQRDAAGNVILLPGTRTGAPITTDPVRSAQLTRVDRGLHAQKEYLRFFPSFNASFNVRENLIARAGYYHSIGRPDFAEYSSGLTLPDTENLPSGNNRITVNNVGLKAWSAKSTKVRLEYYFERVGQISIGAFQRDFENFFGSTVFNATPAFLALYGLDPTTYDPYDVVTKHNLQSTVRMTGLEFDYKQALTFLPPWARGVQVFANASALRATGEGASNFAGYVPRTASWGVSLTRPKYNVRMNWNYRGRQRRGIVATGRSIEPGTYNWGSKALYIDLTAEYYFWKQVGLFANLRNLGTAPQDAEVAGPSTPPHAQFRSRQDNASLWTMGLKGTF